MKILFLLLSTAAVLIHGNKLVGHIQDTRLCLIASILLGLLCVCTVTALLLNGRRHRPACPDPPKHVMGYDPSSGPDYSVHGLYRLVDGKAVLIQADYAQPKPGNISAAFRQQHYGNHPIHLDEWRESSPEN